MLSRAFAIAALAGAALLAAACVRSPAPVANVPIQESAAAQFKYAENYRASLNLALTDAEKDRARFNRNREVIRQTYQKVEEYFPADRVYTPLAILNVIEMDAGLDDVRVKVGADQLERVMRQLDDLAAEYPEHEFIQAKTLYDKGLIQIMRENYARAQEYFLELRDTYRESSNEAIRTLAQRAAYYYNRTYVNQ